MKNRYHRWTRLATNVHDYRLSYPQNCAPNTGRSRRLLGLTPAFEVIHHVRPSDIFATVVFISLVGGLLPLMRALSQAPSPCCSVLALASCSARCFFECRRSAKYWEKKSVAGAGRFPTDLRHGAVLSLSMLAKNTTAISIQWAFQHSSASRCIACSGHRPRRRSDYAAARPGGVARRDHSQDARQHVDLVDPALSRMGTPRSASSIYFFPYHSHRRAAGLLLLPRALARDVAVAIGLSAGSSWPSPPPTFYPMCTA